MLPLPGPMHFYRHILRLLGVVIGMPLLLVTCRDGATSPGAIAVVFSVEPTEETAGAPIGPAVRVEARDASGHLVSSFSGSVTVAIKANPGGGTLTGTTTVSALGGTAVFSSLILDKAGTGYTLSAAAPGLAQGTSMPFDVIPGAPTKLGFTTQPTTAEAGATLSPAVNVVVQDAFGNSVPDTAAVAMTVAITPGTGASGAALSGTTTVTASAGVASFSTLSIDKSGTGYTLTARANGLADATSGPFDIAAAAATILVFSVQPTPSTAGATIAPSIQVTALDALGNRASGFTGNVTAVITDGTGTTGAILAGTSTVHAVAGVATFSTLNIDKSGVGYTLSATATGLVSATSEPFDIVVGQPSHLAFTVQPRTSTAGEKLSPAVQVTVRDAQGNTATGFAGDVTLAIGTNPAGGTLSGTATVAAVAGVASFSTLSIDRAGKDYTLSAAATALTGTTSDAFDINPSTPAKLVFAVQPSTTTTGAPISPAVRVAAQDSLGNVVPGFTSNVLVTIGTNPAGGTLSGTTTVSAVAGIATFASLRIDNIGSGYTLAATSPGVDAAVSSAFDIIASVPTQLAFTVQPSSASAGTVIAPSVEVTTRDASGQTVTSFTGNVTLTISAGSGTSGATLSGTTTVAAVAGVATFSNLSIDRSGEEYTLMATSAGLASATSGPFVIMPGPATQLVFSVQPSAATAHAQITPQVEVMAQDTHGNRATGFTGNVTLAFATNPTGATLSGTTTVAAVAGVAAFGDLSIDLAGSGYTLAATASGLAGATSGTLDVTSAPVSRLTFTVEPATAVAGSSIAPAIELTAHDGAGGTVTSFTGTVTLSITAGTGADGATLSGVTSVAAVAGVATFSDVRLDKAATGYRLSATAAGGGLAGTTSGAFDVNAAPAARLKFTVEPSTTPAATAISPPVQVIARDGFGNPATGFNGNVTVAIGANPPGGILSGTTTVTAVGGVATFSNLRIDNAGSGYTLTASSAGLTASTSSAFSIVASAPTQLAFTVQPVTTTAGAAIPQIQVSARDVAGNLVSAFTGDIAIAIGTNAAGGTLSGTKTITAVGGSAMFSSLTLDKAGVGYTIVATASGLASATSERFAVVAGPASQLVFSTQPGTTTTGATIAPAVRVTARDAFGNTATAFAGNITIGIASNPGGGVLTGTRTFAAIDGNATFSNLKIDGVGSGYTLSATTSGLGVITSSAFDIIPSTPTQLAFTVQPTGTADTAVAGSVITPAIEVTVRDASGQPVADFVGPVSVSIGAGNGVAGATLSGTTTVSAVGGIATFDDLRIDRTGGYRLTATSGALPSAISAFFAITPGPATQVVFTVQPSTATAQATIAPQVEITQQDALGNTVTAFSGNVTVAIEANPAGGILAGTTTVAAVAGIAALPGLSIDKPGAGYTLTASTSGIPTVTSSAFNVTAARATALAFTVQPTTTGAGATISPSLQLTARDAKGQTATAFTGNVTLTISAGSGTSGAVLSGTRTAAAVAGIATFTNLNIDRSGSGYKLSATATGLAGTASAPFTITPGPANRLAFTVQPDSTIAGTPIRPFEVTVRDSLGNPAKSFTGDVTVTIETNAGGGTLSGTRTVAAVEGVAAFSDLSIDKAGNGYRLEATAAGLIAVRSRAFSIVPGAPTHLVFSVQPSNAAPGATISPAVRVSVLDNLGNVVRTFGSSLTVSIAAGTGTAGATLSGTTTVATVNGVAIFSDLKINLAGSGYRLKAASTGVQGITSIPFGIP
jgi:hypothetical protein